MESQNGPMKAIDADPLMIELRGNYLTWKTSNIASKQGFFPIYNDFETKGTLKEISGNALKLFIYLGIHSKNDTGESWHSAERIADYFDCDKRTVMRWFEELEDKGLIKRIQKGYKRVANTFLCPY